MKAALGVLGGVLATLALAILIFWAGWLRPPSASSVCENVVRVSQAESVAAGGEPDAAGLDALYRECRVAATTPPQFGRAPWVKRLECMRDAPDYAGLRRCEEIRGM